MKHVDVKKILTQTNEYLNGEVTVCGWVRTAREGKSVAFIELNDGTTFKNIQLVIDKENNPDNTYKSAMAVGTSLKAIGTLVASQNNGCEILVKILPFSALVHPIILYRKNVIRSNFCVLFPTFAFVRECSKRFLPYAINLLMQYTDISTKTDINTFSHPLSRVLTAKEQAKCLE